MQDGDFIKIDYEMRAGEDRQLIETNVEKTARDNGIFEENGYYGDFVAIVGSDLFFKVLNESFLQAEVGKEYEITIKPEDAFGVRDPKNIHVHTVREFERLKIEPEVGKEVVVNRRRGKVISVTPGRIVVDYNNRYAGKTIFYKYTVREKVEDVPAKATAILRIYYPKEATNFTVTSDSNAIRIVVSEASKFDLVWLEAKYQIVNEIRKYVKDFDIDITEHYSKQAEEKPAAEGGEIHEPQASEQNVTQPQ
jgi:peptidylprolyl isomerase